MPEMSPAPGLNIQRTVLTTDAAGLATWTFPVPYMTPPVIGHTVEAVDDASIPGVKIIERDANHIKIRVSKTTAVSVALIGLAVQVGQAPGPTSIHLIAAAQQN